METEKSPERKLIEGWFVPILKEREKLFNATNFYNDVIVKGSDNETAADKKLDEENILNNIQAIPWHLKGNGPYHKLTDALMNMELAIDAARDCIMNIK
jgi:hypothetical protein